jgi:hypothetical protein
VVLKYHRDALDGCGSAAKDASGAFDAVAGSVSGAVVGDGAFGQLANGAALIAAVHELQQEAGNTSLTLRDRLQAVERALDAVDQTFTGADGAAVSG